MATLIGTTATQTLKGGSSGDIIKDEKGGSDQLIGNGGDDIITATRTSSSSADKLTLDGGTGDDLITFNGGRGPATATILGGDGDDQITVKGAKAANINAGAGYDYVTLDLAGAQTGGVFDVTLGSSADVLDVRSTNGAVIRIKDFLSDDPGVGDLLDLSHLLVNRLTGWDMHTNPFVTGHLGLVQRGSDVVLQIDYNGGANSFSDLVIFQNRTVASFQYDDRGITGYAPDKSAPDNLTKNGGSGDNSIEGRSGNDKLYGNGGNDEIYASFGHDTLDGGSGADTLDGWAGNDRFLGGAGNDLMTGGYGNDTFVFDKGAGKDRITDFVAGGSEDRLDLSALASAGVKWTIAQSGADTLISFSDGGAVTLVGVTASSLVQSGSFIL